MRSVSPGLQLRSLPHIIMSYFRRSLQAVIVMAMALSASLAVAVQCTEYKVNFTNGVWKQSKGAACAAIAGAKFGTSEIRNPGLDASGNNCNFDTYDDLPNDVPDAGMIKSGSSGLGIIDRINADCPPPSGNEACFGDYGAGKTGSINWTEGYTRTPDEGDRASVGGPVNRVPPTGEICMPNGCKIIAQASGPGVQPYVSQSPHTNGLYRRSLDLPYVATGEGCTAGSAPAGVKTDAPAPACPGAVGEVNGKLGCYGTAQAPVITTTNPRTEGSPETAGNPAAGIKPATGTGAGIGGVARTPTNGNGGNAGGPAAAAVGGPGGSAGGTPNRNATAGTVTPGSGKEQQACGAPGQPVCAVKIDEGKTSDKADFEEAKTALDTWGETVGQKINEAHGIQAPAWSFSFQFPTGCAPLDLGSFKGTSFSFNPCAHQDKIHDLLSMVWAAVTAFCVIGMVGRAIRES